MPIEQLTPGSEIDAMTEREIRRMRKAIIRILSYVGERSVVHVRTLPSPSAADFPTYPRIPPHQPYFIDWTGNLRSSVGYVTVEDGKIVKSGGFDGNGDEGERRGRTTARRAAREFPEGYALIVVAGMNYAAYVTDKGYDVLDSAETLAVELARKLLGQLTSE